MRILEPNHSLRDLRFRTEMNMLSPAKYLDLQGLEEVWAKITEKFGTSEYSLIEYLESHATSKTNGPYIDTGVTLTDSCTIEAMFQFQNMDNHTNLCLYGSRETTTATSNARIGFGWSESINNFRFDYAKENNTVSVSNPLDTFVLKQQVNNLYINSTTNQGKVFKHVYNLGKLYQKTKLKSPI